MKVGNRFKKIMMKRLLYLSIAFLSVVILALIIVAMRSLYPNYCLSALVIILSKVVFMGAYLLFPLFFIYQIIKHIRINFMYQNTMRKRIKKRTTEFTISIITFVVLLVSILFYIGLYWLVDRAVTNAYRSA